jgi:hypothetical protein
MIPPIYAIASADEAVQALLGPDSNGGEMRLYPFGYAEQGVLKPYVVYQTIGGSPENYLSGRPDEDAFAVQIDVYGTTAASVLAVTAALNHALELDCHITRWGNESRDPLTKIYRFDFDVEFITSR